MKKALLAAALAPALIGTAMAAEPQQITVTLTSASPMSQGMAMVLANQMQEQGAQVDILLCDAAGALALQLEQPTAIKRPLVEWAGGAPAVTVGCTPDAWRQRLL